LSPDIFRIFEGIVARHVASPTAALEVGASHKTLLDIAGLAGAQKTALNIAFSEKSRSRLEGRVDKLVEANSNRLPFDDASFDCILSSSTLEHDKYFWKSLAEIRRVLRPGGVFVVGVPAYLPLPTDWLHTTLTFARHGERYNADYYRFSAQCVREILLEELACLEESIARRYPNPYVVAAGRKA
jgi:ubiquinone/menaquinone biosynthesis C-methylase UbiE